MWLAGVTVWFGGRAGGAGGAEEVFGDTGRSGSRLRRRAGEVTPAGRGRKTTKSNTLYRARRRAAGVLQPRLKYSSLTAKTARQRRRAGALKRGGDTVPTLHFPPCNLHSTPGDIIG
ncbi:hypothetical protein SKAU_G00080930 [Synaphobranchus kaupii]|uniref:Uncharacterized protein n=1 Tax=Synaphobranchus kaupii TaxID=118154 RepID=A0A9Q1FVN3_SYNKA|nr:hypothetical protein SKAU_G00080930 [Synaphobranchus kaupii]